MAETETVIIKRIGVISVAKISAVIGLIIGIIIAVYLGIIMLIIGSFIGRAGIAVQSSRLPAWVLYS